MTHCWKTEKSVLNKTFRLVFLLLLPFSADDLNAGEVIDFTQTKIIIQNAPHRIVTLAPSLGELTADLLGENLDEIVGVSELSDYPPALKTISSVGSFQQFSLEKIVSLKPDLVLATFDGNPKDKVLHLRELGIPVITVGSGTFAEIGDSIRMIGEGLGRKSQGIKMAAQLTTGIQNIRKKAQKYTAKSVMLQLASDPLMVVGKKSFLNEALEIVHAENVYGNVDAHYPTVSMEDVFLRDPEVIIILAHGPSHGSGYGKNPGNDLDSFERIAQKWSQFSYLKAVQLHQVYVLRSDTLLRPTLRILEGLSLLEKIIYENR